MRKLHSTFLVALLGLAGLLPMARAVAPTPVTLTNSVQSVAPAGTTTGGRPFISRAGLTTQESAAPLDFEVSLKMRNFDELQQRVQKGEQIASAEMAGRYEPTAADYKKLVEWAKSQGFTIVRKDDHHLVLFLRGRVDQVGSVFSATFARVKYRGNEYTSAVTAPSIPAEFADTVLGVNGLQPHLHPHKHLIKKQSAVKSASDGSDGYTPAQVASAYNATSLYNAKINGSGETIAIVIDTFPSTDDLVQFWTNANVPQSISNMQFIQVVSGQLADPSGEETLDTEWASSMAPGAKVRVYASLDLYDDDVDQAFEQVLTDVTDHPEDHIHEMSMSFGEGENDTTSSEANTRAQIFSELATKGVTIFASSGDGGSTPDDNEDDDGEQGPLQVESPASDPSITAVGGTSLRLNSSNAVTSETVWNSDGGASGGGISIYFSRPTWQSGTGVSTSARRQVPDIAATADPDYGGLVYLDGAPTVYGGTSLATPICAGLCALANEARVNSGQATLGLLGPHIYPLIGTSNFRDITSGNNATANSNGKYAATTGYDLCTGIGAPLTQALTVTLVGSSTLHGLASAAPMVEVQPGADASFTVSASGSSPIYQWQRQPVGGSTFSNISDSSTYSGSTQATLTVASATAAMSGDEFQCLVTFDSTTITTSPSTLIVETPLAVTTLAGSASNSGGFVNATSTAAQFNYPSGVALDSAGNIWVADYNNNAIRKITPGGLVTSPFGNLSGSHGATNGNGNAATFYYPNGVAIDSSDNIYVADTGNNLIRKITGNTVTTLVGASAGLSTPGGVAVDGSGNVYIADSGNNIIRKVTPAGTVTTLAGRSGLAGSTDGAAMGAAEFNSPEAVAVNSAGTIVYVADFGNATVRKISGGQVTTVAGVAGLAGYRDGLGTAALFNAPSGLALDSAGNLYITDSLYPPVDSAGDDFTGAGNDVVRKLSTSGVVSTLAGDPDVDGSSDGTGTSAKFFSVQAVAVDSSGDLILADTYNQTIREAHSTGQSSGTGVTATISLSNLTSTYDGTAKSATVTTSPAGLSYTITYSGSATVPTDAGSYTVIATVTASGYSGSTTGTLVISPAAATISFGSTQATYNGNAQGPAVTTTPSGLDTEVLYNGTTLGPINAGSYTVTATLLDSNYVAAAAKETFTITKAAASVDVDGQSVTYDGARHGVTPVTSPTGLAVTCTYNGSASLPVKPGSYAVVGTVKDTNYAGSGTGTFTITKGTPSLAFSGTGASGSTITVAYNGKAHAATVTTTPAGLPVTYVYTINGSNSSTAPTLVGTYGVQATVNNVDYAASLSGTLTITPILPVLSTVAIKPLAESATVTATLNPEGSATTTLVQYGTSTSYGASVSGTNIAAGTMAATTTVVLPGLAPKTVYHYRLVATNAAGAATGADKTFTTLAAPTLGTDPQILLGASGAEVGLAVTPNGYATTVYFKYGTSTAYGSTTAVQSIGSGTAAVNVYALFPQLAVHTTYDYQMVVTNAAGTFTEDGSFTTASYDTTIVETTGSVAPSNASGTTTFASFGNAILNSADGVAFKGTMTGEGITPADATGIWADIGSNLELVAQVGAVAPGAGSAVFASLGDPVYDDDADYAFIGGLKTGVGGVTTSNAAGIWASSGGSLELAAQQGGTAPGAGSATFSVFSSCGLVENGDVIFGATLAGAGATTATNTGIWEGTPGNLALELRNGATIDGIKTLAQFSFLPAQTVVNGQTREFSPASGNLVCNATFTDKSTGIVDVVSGTPHVVVISGAAADEITGATFASFSHPAINDSGNTAFAATLTLNVGGVTSATSKGIWADDSGHTRRLIARSGSGNAPSATAPFVSFSDPVYNSSNEVAFVGTLSAGSGIWYTTGGTLTNVALSGGNAPGCPSGANFATFTELALNDNGGVSFLATLTPSTVGGVTSANNMGIWAVDNTGTLSLIVRTGDTFNGKTVSAISFLPTGASVYGQSRSVDRPTGDLVYGVTFSDKTTAICNVVFP